MNGDKVNGAGVWLRFITPVLVTVAIFLLSLLIADMRELKEKFNNHLQHHVQLEVTLESRLTRIETLISNLK
jgi:hypothetical protein